jgi:hypothetical protein
MPAASGLGITPLTLTGGFMVKKVQKIGNDKKKSDAQLSSTAAVVIRLAVACSAFNTAMLSKVFGAT